MVRKTTGSASTLVVALVSLCGVLACEQPMFDTSGSGSSSFGGVLVLAGTSNATPPVGGEGALPTGCSEHPVEPPAGGASAVDDEICSATMEPVLAPDAVRLHLAVTNNDVHQPAAGTLSFAEGVRGRLNGDPVISIEPLIVGSETRVSTLPEQTDDGYAFTVYFDPKLQLVSNDQTRLKLNVTFDYRCEAGSRLAIAVIELRLCGGFPTPATWSAPGETCVVCYENYPGTSPNP